MRMFVKGGIGVFCLLLFLALASNTPEDIAILHGGIGEYAVVNNWVGRIGAWLSYYLLLWLGIAAYPGVMLILLCAVSRMFNQQRRPVTFFYYIGIVSFILGTSMLLGCFPDFMRGWQEHYNQIKMPGGTLGLRFCVPGATIERPGGQLVELPPGWLSFVMNTTGCVIVSATLLLMGLVSVWIHDWHAQTKLLIAHWKAGSKLRREERHKQAALKERETAKANKTQSTISKPKPKKEENPIPVSDSSDKTEKPEEKQDELELKPFDFDPIDDPKSSDASVLDDRKADVPEADLSISLEDEDDDDSSDITDDLLDDQGPITSPPRVQPPRPIAIAAQRPTPAVASVAAQQAQPDLIPPSPVPTPAGSSKGESTFQPQNYALPPLKLLAAGPESGSLPPDIEAKKRILQETLESFGIDAEVGDATCGPRVTLYEIKPAPGVKVERISNLSNNIAMNLKAESLRILTPIPGKDTVGIEAPNSVSSLVSLRDLLESKSFNSNKHAIPIALGKDIAGKPVILDLARAPHLLIAGATGSGKSVCINTLILSLLYRFRPDECKMIMVDPKVVEFSGYGSLPHLVTPVVTESAKVPVVLRWVLQQMEWRYRVLSKVGVRNLASYNSRAIPPEPILDDEGKPIPDRMPFLIVIIDELADIMMTAKQDVETSLARIAQLARAVGIHAVVATQRPSVNVITGVIKANFPTRIAFQVSSVPDSRTILDTKGAETLLGRGDMLFKAPGGSKMSRVQGALVDDPEIDQVVSFISAQAEPEFADDVYASGKSSKGSDVAVTGYGGEDGPSVAPADDAEMDDEERLIQQAIQMF